MKKSIKFLFLILFIANGSTLTAQKKNITLEDIWAKGTFRSQSVQNINWMKDGAFYSALENGKIIKHQVTDGAAVETLFDQASGVENLGKKLDMEDYSMSSDEQKILISAEGEPIYRRSSREENYVYDLKTKKIAQLS